MIDFNGSKTTFFLVSVSTVIQFVIVQNLPIYTFYLVWKYFDDRQKMISLRRKFLGKQESTKNIFLFTLLALT